MAPIMIGMMGSGLSATPRHQNLGYGLGYAIASIGWVVLISGRIVGVMAVTCRDTQVADRLIVGIVPSA
jgi:predicted Rossmann-fold nucleotide-binding protein